MIGRFGCAAVLALALGACGQSTTSAPSGAQSGGPSPANPGALELSCSAFVGATGAALEARFGVANVVQQNVSGAEGQETPGTVIYPNDPAKRAEIMWNDPAQRTSISSVTVSGTQGQTSQWVGPRGVHLGEAIADVEHANGGAFLLYGFDWDYGGAVTNWRGGAFAPANNCTTQVGFQPGGDAGAAAGENAFRSDANEMAAVHPYVSEFGVSFLGGAGTPVSGKPN
jgi:hypothetical protein